MTEPTARAALNRPDWLLLLLDRDALGAEGPEGLDPVRIQKGMFLLSKRGPARGLYDFRAYDWGPFSSDIYTDLAMLARRGYLSEERVLGRTWSTYRVTAQGHERAVTVAANAGAGSSTWLRQAREFLTSRSFAQLLREIYELYPDYAVNSRFGG
jgi:uncharacterized protein YwgA